MSKIFVPQPWTKQPQVWTPAQPGRQMSLLWSGRFPLAPSIGRPVTTVVGTALPRPTTQGIAADFTTTQYYRWDTAATGTNPNAATMFCLLALNANTDYTACAMSNVSATTQLFRIWNQSAASRLSVDFRDDASTLVRLAGPSAPAITGTTFYFVVAVFRSGSGKKEIWVDGIPGDTSTTSLGTITLNQTEVGALVRNSPIQHWNGPIALFGIEPRAWPAEEIIAISKNPWQLFAPQTSRIYFGAAAAGPTYTLTAANASFTLTGQDAALKASRLLTAANATYALTGQDVSLKAGRKLVADHATYTLTGQDVSLVYTPGVTYSMQAGVGSFSLTGQAVNLTAQRLLSAEHGIFALTGQAANLVYSPAATDATVGYGPGWAIDFGNTGEIEKRIAEERKDRDQRRQTIEGIYKRATGQPLVNDADIDTLPVAKPAQRARVEAIRREQAAIREIDESINRLEARIEQASELAQEEADIAWIVSNVI